MTNVGHFPRKCWLAAGGAISFGTMVVLWGYSRSVPLSAAVNCGQGASLSVMQIAARSLVQRIVPNAIQGRVLSLFLLNMGLAQLMTAPVGVLAQAWTLERVVPVLGWLALGLALSITFVRADVRRAGLASAGRVIRARPSSHSTSSRHLARGAMCSSGARSARLAA